MKRGSYICLCGAALLAAVYPGERGDARDLWLDGEGEPSVELNSSLKATMVAPEGTSALSLWRLRLGLASRLGEQVKLGVEYEHRARIAPAGNTDGLAVLPADTPAPYRIIQLDDTIIQETDSYSYRHELDRAFVALHFDAAEVTLGRQSIGWGRGVLFGAVDMFSSFSPFELDREWRRGVDAVRADIKLTDTYSLDIVGAFGEDRDSSAFLGRFRGRTESGALDTELIFGKRGEDTVYAGTFSASVRDAAVYGELAVLSTPEGFPDGSPLFGGSNTVMTAVLGASYTFDIYDGVTLWGEYHFSGFGSDDIADSVARLGEPAFLARYQRSDMRILGRHAVAVQASCAVGDSWAAGLVWIANVQDGSGVTAPSLTWSVSDNVTIIGSAYFPYGTGADEMGIPQSEYGGSPITGFLQIQIYD